MRGGQGFFFGGDPLPKVPAFSPPSDISDSGGQCPPYFATSLCQPLTTGHWPLFKAVPHGPIGPPVKHEKSGRAGVLARHPTGLMVRRTQRKILNLELFGTVPHGPLAHPQSMKRSVGRASAPARRSTQAGKPVPPEELFRTASRTEAAGTQSLAAIPVSKGGRAWNVSFTSS